MSGLFRWDFWNFEKIFKPRQPALNTRRHILMQAFQKSVQIELASGPENENPPVEECMSVVKNHQSIHMQRRILLVC